jgi:hypothetical protein
VEPVRGAGGFGPQDKSHPHGSIRKPTHADGSGCCCALLGGNTLGKSDFGNAPNEAAIALDKRELVGEAGFQQNGYAVVTREVSGRGERDVLPDAHMGKADELRQHIQTPGNRRLNFVEFFAEVLEERLPKLPGQLHRLLSEHPEALIQSCENTLRYESPGFNGFLDLRIFDNVGDLVEDFRTPFRAVSGMAKEHEENIFRVFYWHWIPSVGRILDKIAYSISKCETSKSYRRAEYDTVTLVTMKKSFSD